MSDNHSANADTESQIIERLYKMVRRWPEVSGCYLQPEAHVVDGIIHGLARSQMMFGHSYCP